MLKRKNDEVEENGAKRVALDAELIERHDIEEDQAKTASATSAAATATESTNAETLEETNESLLAENNKLDVTMHEEGLAGVIEPTTASSLPDLVQQAEGALVASNINVNNNNNNNNNDDDDGDGSRLSGPISSHKIDDPTYVHFRMLCPVKQASLIVGKGGEKISHIKEAANCRINVSDNLRTVPERIVSVRGPAENVAKAFGLMVRALVDEPEDQPSGADSQPFAMKLLFPHPVMGYIIGKKGARFREIEENSAARLKLEERTLPQSTDRVLNVTGVADAIHIATYYIAQTVLENKQLLAKCIFYNPANHNLRIPASFPQMIPGTPAMMLPGLPIQMQMQMPPQMLNMMGAGPVGYNTNGRVRAFNSGYVNANVAGVPMMAMGQGEKIEQDYHVPKEHIGLVIGKGGSNVKHIREVTKCYVKINPEVEGADTRVLTLQGTANSIQAAIQMISNKVDHEKKKLAQQKMQINQS